MPSRNRNMQGGKSVVSDLAPRTSRTGSGQINDNWVGVFPPMPIPTFGSVTATSGGYTVPITNYDSAATYVVTTTAGSVSQSSGTITQSGLGNNTSATVTVTVSKTGFTTSIAVIAGTSQTQLAAPTFSASTGTSGGWTATITNYDAANTYSLSTTAGSASQTSGTITQSGLGNNVSSTVTVTVSRSGFVSNSGTVSGTSQSQLAAPTFSGSTATAGGWTATITNYDASITYSLSTTDGSVSRSGSTITQSGIGNGVSTTVTVGVSKSGFVYNSGTVAGTSQGKLATPTLSGTTATTGGFTFTITNYDAANTYTISTSAGSVSRSGGTITQSGLGNGASATVSVTASRSGFVSSDTATRAGTSTPNCSSCTYAYTQVEGGNCCCTGMCGAPNQVCCYNIVVYSGNPAGCIGCNASIGSWYACDGTC